MAGLVVRTKRGLCPKCAYPLGESPVCTQCGQGNMAAIKLFLEYVAGKPEDEELRERLEQLEAMVNGVEQNVY